MKKLGLLLTLLVAAQAFGSALTIKQIDTIQNSTGGSAVSTAAVGSTYLSDTNSVVVTGKSMSGASNTFTAIPGSAISSGQVGVANGGTGLGTLTSGAVILGAGTSSPTFVSPGTSGNVLTSNGSTWTSAAAASTAPVVSGTQASPLSVSAAGGIVLTTPSTINQAFVVSTSGAVTVTATPSITSCTSAGQVLYILGEDASNVITLQDNSALAGSALFLNGNWTSGLNKTLTLSCDGAAHWVEVARSG